MPGSQQAEAEELQIQEEYSQFSEKLSQNKKQRLVKYITNVLFMAEDLMITHSQNMCSHNFSLKAVYCKEAHL